MKPEDIVFPEGLYTRLAHNLRSRIRFAQHVFTLDEPKARIVETVCLQGRKIIETIAYMALVATHHGLGLRGVPNDAKLQWNAETILTRMKKKRLTVLPSPSTITGSPLTGSQPPDYNLVVNGVPEYRLSHEELISIYRNFHKGLHETNPYAREDNDEFYLSLLPTLQADLEKLKNFTWSHFISIKGRGFMVKLEDSNGNLSVLPLAKIAELPGNTTIADHS
jgi:hypothetical protein